jgi:3-phenylpropionate/trans-cinnamate dioxygenase ferredoxin subunit
MVACLTSELPPGSMRNVDILGHTVMVANVNGQYFAMDGICSHGFADLSRGTLEGYAVECPRHQARFDVRTGKVLQGPVNAEGRAFDLHSYPVQVSEGCVTVDV